MKVIYLDRDRLEPLEPSGSIPGGGSWWMSTYGVPEAIEVSQNPEGVLTLAFRYPGGESVDGVMAVDDAAVG